MNRTTIWVGAVIVLLVGIFVVVLALGRNTVTPGSEAVLSEAVSANDWSIGNKDSQVTIVEYADFQCPACASYHPLLKKLKDELDSKFQFVYRNFPLAQHANAKISAYAAGAAGKQGKFWEMHDKIFESQDKWAVMTNAQAKETYISYATALGLNIEQFKKDLDSKEVQDKVQNDYNSGVRSQVNATPTFFLNGKKISNPLSYDEFKRLIEQSQPSPSSS